MPAAWPWPLVHRLRWGCLFALIGGILLNWRSFPTRPPQDWTVVHTFELESGECDTLREARTTTDWSAPHSLSKSPSLGDVANKFRLELALVCQANDRFPETCGAETDASGRLKLPLYRESPPRRVRRTP